MEDSLLLPREGAKAAATGWGGEFKEEGGRLGRLAAPMVAVSASQYLLQVISTAMVGHLGELSLSAAAIATSLTAVTGFYLLLGMASGLETLCGQAYGAKQFQKIGMHTYSAIFSLILVCLPISFVWISLEKLLTFIGQDPLISLEAGKYAFWMIPGLFAYAFSQPMMKFLQAQSLVLPMLISSIVALCFHIPLCWILVFKFEMEITGAALSVSISYWLNALVLGLYIKYSASCKATRSPLSREAFKGVKEFMKLAFPSAVMLCLEYWAFELLILMSGLLPNAKLETSVLSICLTSISVIYTIPYGLGAAASTRVSNELGSGNSQGACMVVRVVMFITTTMAIIMGGTLFSLRNVLGSAYSNEEEVINYVKELVPLVCLSVLMDSVQGVLSGVARGCGWQDIGAYVNLGAFYLVGIPASIILGFVFHMRGKGLWIGVLCGSIVQTILLSLITRFTDWEKQAKKARERIFMERLPLQSGTEVK